MNITRAKKMIKHLLIKHKLYCWEVYFSNIDNSKNSNKAIVGITWHDMNLIELDKSFFKTKNTRQCRDIVLHEIAHALVGNENQQHGYEWRKKCKEIGAIPKAFLCRMSFNYNVS